MLEIGTKAPAFTLPDQNGEPRSLADYQGQKVILYFYPKDMTAGCTKQACAFGELYPQFREKGAVVLGVSKDSVASHKKFEEKYGLPFTLLSDPEKEVIQAYDVWKEKKNYGKVSMGVVRTTYLIDENGIIVKAFDKVKAADNPAQKTELTITTDSGIYYNPALQEVRDLVCEGVVEIVKNYNVDGIHFDDYFYPDTATELDAAHYAAYSGNMSLEDWRRENVNMLVKQVYAAV